MRIIATKMFRRHPSDLRLVNASSLDDHDFLPSSWHPSFVGALHLSAFESLRIGKSPNSCVYENTSFQEPAVNLYLVQAAQCISLPGNVPLRKLSMEVCPPPLFPRCRLIDFLFNDFLCWARSRAARADWARRACAFLLCSSAVL